MVLDLLLMLFVSSTVASPAIYDMWLRCPCVLQNCINAALGAVIWNVCMARICLFYRLNQLGTEDRFENTFADKVVSVCGYFNCPAVFWKLEDRVRGSTIPTPTSEKSSIRSGSTTGTDEISKQEILKERILWVLKVSSRYNR